MFSGRGACCQAKHCDKKGRENAKHYIYIFNHIYICVYIYIYIYLTHYTYISSFVILTLVEGAEPLMCLKPKRPTNLCQGTGWECRRRANWLPNVWEFAGQALDGPGSQRFRPQVWMFGLFFLSFYSSLFYTLILSEIGELQFFQVPEDSSHMMSSVKKRSPRRSKVQKLW